MYICTQVAINLKRLPQMCALFRSVLFPTDSVCSVVQTVHHFCMHPKIAVRGEADVLVSVTLQNFSENVDICFVSIALHY